MASETESGTATAVKPGAPADTLHGWFALQAARSPHATALTAGGDSLSYVELHERAVGIAGRLYAAGVRPGDLVPVLVPRRLAVPAILGVLLAGATYVPLDPRYPDARLAGVVERVGARVMLADDELAARARAWYTGSVVRAGGGRGPRPPGHEHRGRPG